MSTPQVATMLYTPAEDFDRRRHMVIFAIIAFVQLTMVEILGIPELSLEYCGAVDFLIPPDNDPRDEEWEWVIDIEPKFIESWEIFFFRITELIFTTDYIKFSENMPPSAKDKMLDLAEFKQIFELLYRSLKPHCCRLDPGETCDPEEVLHDANLKPFIHDYAEYERKQILELRDLNAHAIVVEMFELGRLAADGMDFLFPHWQSALRLFNWAADPEAGAWGRLVVALDALNIPPVVDHMPEVSSNLPELLFEDIVA